MYIGKHRKVYIGGNAPWDFLSLIKLGQDLCGIKKSRGLIKAP